MSTNECNLVKNGIGTKQQSVRACRSSARRARRAALAPSRVVRASAGSRPGAAAAPRPAAASSAAACHHQRGCTSAGGPTRSFRRACGALLWSRRRSRSPGQNGSKTNVQICGGPNDRTLCGFLLSALKERQQADSFRQQRLQPLCRQGPLQWERLADRGGLPRGTARKHVPAAPGGVQTVGAGRNWFFPTLIIHCISLEEAARLAAGDIRPQLALKVTGRERPDTVQ